MTFVSDTWLNANVSRNTTSLLYSVASNKKMLNSGTRKDVRKNVSLKKNILHLSTCYPFPLLMSVILTSKSHHSAADMSRSVSPRCSEPESYPNCLWYPPVCSDSPIVTTWLWLKTYRDMGENWCCKTDPSQSLEDSEHSPASCWSLFQPQGCNHLRQLQKVFPSLLHSEYSLIGIC